MLRCCLNQVPRHTKDYRGLFPTFSNLIAVISRELSISGF